MVFVCIKQHWLDISGLAVSLLCRVLWSFHFLHEEGVNLIAPSTVLKFAFIESKLEVYLKLVFLSRDHILRWWLINSYKEITFTLLQILSIFRTPKAALKMFSLTQNCLARHCYMSYLLIFFFFLRSPKTK